VSDQKNKNPNPLLCNATLSFKNPNSLARSKIDRDNFAPKIDLIYERKKYFQTLFF
jgi:hypothetical protein